MKAKEKKVPKKIVIELDWEFPETGPSSVNVVYSDGSVAPFAQAKDLKKVLKAKAESHPPKFLEASSITIVQTNPCRWVKINGVWRWICT